MNKVMVVLFILLVLVIVVFVFLLMKKSKKKEIVYYEEEKCLFNQSDIDRLNGVNDKVITGKKKQSNINIPDFDKSKPIGYKDISHIDNSYGDRVVSSNNQNTK